jgi:hypothetical protein
VRGLALSTVQVQIAVDESLSRIVGYHPVPGLPFAQCAGKPMDVVLALDEVDGRHDFKRWG